MTAPAIPEPTQLATVEQIERAASEVELFAEICTSVPELTEVQARWAAVTEYAKRRSRQGLGRAEAAARVIELRLGRLIRELREAGELPSQGQHGKVFEGSKTSDMGIAPQDVSEFVAMAEHPDIVEDLIAQSTDTQPVSRNKIRTAIRAAKQSATNTAIDQAWTEGLAERGIDVPTDPEEIRRRKQASELIGQLLATLDEVAALERIAPKLRTLPGLQRHDIQQMIHDAHRVLNLLENK